MSEKNEVVFEKNFGEYKGRALVQKGKHKVRIVVKSMPPGYEEEVAEKVRKLWDERGLDYKEVEIEGGK